MWRFESVIKLCSNRLLRMATNESAGAERFGHADGYHPSALTKFQQALFGGATAVYSMRDDKTVYIGSCVDAISDAYALVINCAEDLPKLCADTVTYEHIALNDDADSDLSLLTSERVDELASLVSAANGDVLFHCVVGSSRSVAICCAVLARVTGRPWQRLYESICDKRSCVNLNTNFVRDLDDHDF